MSIKNKLSAIIICALSCSVSHNAMASEVFALSATVQSQCTISGLTGFNHSINLDNIFDVFGAIKASDTNILPESAVVRCNAGRVTVGLRSQKGALVHNTDQSNIIPYIAIATVGVGTGALQTRLDADGLTYDASQETNNSITTDQQLTLKLGTVQNETPVAAGTYTDTLTLVVSNYP